MIGDCSRIGGASGSGVKRLSRKEGFRKPKTLSSEAYRRVVVVGHANLPVDKAADCYALPNQNVFDYAVEVYNFSDSTSGIGTVDLTVPDGWKIEKGDASLLLLSWPAARAQYERVSDSFRQFGYEFVVTAGKTTVGSGSDHP